MRRSTLIFLVVLLGLLVSTSVHAATSHFLGVMLGSYENPGNISPARGFAAVTVTGNTLMVDISWHGLTGGNPGAAHIHCCMTSGDYNVNVAVGFPGFPSTTSGTYSHTFDMLDPSIYTMSFLTNPGFGNAAIAEDALRAGLAGGHAYVNIHNMVYPGGEIRANLAPTPEPSSVLLMGAGLLGIAAYAQRRIV